ncbi:hypothetical protein [Bacillus thuringiensis]|uniref:hypothetical protein n=1 Tax=Bacillus thuringiensis TaxID=1428 RepID=UPI0021D676F3|nr:hypothetical protein [Bacillus thuringiensis]MCU7667387.1 hypothetical protein [Bacillus thuringiensis]
MNQIIDEWFKKEEIESDWKEEMGQQKLLLLSNLSEHVVDFFEKSDLQEMRLFSLEEEWGIHFVFEYETIEYKIYTKTSFLGEYLYCVDKILTDFWNIEHGECSIIYEIMMEFIKKHLARRNINL